MRELKTWRRVDETADADGCVSAAASCTHLHRKCAAGCHDLPASTAPHWSMRGRPYEALTVDIDEGHRECSGSAGAQRRAPRHGERRAPRGIEYRVSGAG
jgi:hypothetical protein